MAHLLIIGGSDGGISAGLRAKELDPTVEVTVAASDRYPNFSICGLPFLLSGEVSDWRSLAHRSVSEMEDAGIRFLLEHTATSIDPVTKTVSFIDPEGGLEELGYDRLVMATGAQSVRPSIEGIDHPSVFCLRWMDDAFALQDYVNTRQPRSAIIIGGGYIGMEMADALTYRGMDVTVTEFAESVMTTMDRELGQRVRQELEGHSVRVETGVQVRSLEQMEDQVMVRGPKKFSASADLVLVAVGARPQTGLARSPGIETGIHGAIKVDRFMRTNIPGIYAAGDCAETWHRLLGRPAYLPLGTTAHKQGRIAGENAVGGNREYQGSLGTQTVKIFDLVAARTGLRDSEAVATGFDALTVEQEAWDHKAYYPGATKVCIRLTGDRVSRRLLGAQMVGRRRSQVSKRIDCVAAAIYNCMKVEELNDLDLSYTPPLNSPWDPIQTAAQAWGKASNS